MVRRRTWCLAMLTAAGLATVIVVRRRALEEPVAAPTQKARWVPPVDGACPDGYPVKVNTRSGIVHEPSGRFYDRTVPDRCYATTADAEADGYRRAKA